MKRLPAHRGAVPARRTAPGFTLIELMVTVVIGIIVIVIGSVSVARALESAKVRSEVRNLNELVSAAHGLRSPSGYPSNMIEILRGMEQLPPAFADPGGDVLINAWGGPIELSSPTHHALTVAVGGLPRGACTRLARNFIESNRLQVVIQGSQIPEGDLAQAESSCSSVDSATLELMHNS